MENGRKRIWMSGGRIEFTEREARRIHARLTKRGYKVFIESVEG